MPFPRLPYRRGVVTAVLLLMTATVAFWPRHVLLVDALPAGRPVLIERVEPGSRLSLGFLHSVEHCRVWDHLVVDADYGLVVEATEFAESRTGLPYAAFGDEIFERRGDRFLIRNMQRPVPEIHQWVGARYENTLRLDDGREILLASLAGETLLHLRIVRMPTVRWTWVTVKLYWQHRSF